MKPLLKVLAGEAVFPPPFWFMRQAGRYLPEYHKIRAQEEDFFNLCRRPDLAAELTLQPIRRFRPHAAILFADILLLCATLGKKPTYRDASGPALPPLSAEEIPRLAYKDKAYLAPVFETLRRVKPELPEDCTLLGFAGAPFTLAGFMIAGKGKLAAQKALALAQKDEAAFLALLALITEASIDYLSGQAEAGAEALVLFDSLAGAVPAPLRQRFSLDPLRKIAEGVKARHPSLPVIVFPKGVGEDYLSFAKTPCFDALALDQGLDMHWAKTTLFRDAAKQQPVPVQGNLDPELALQGGTAMRQKALDLCAHWRGRPYIFSLGHGVLPKTPPENIELLAALARNPEQG